MTTICVPDATAAAALGELADVEVVIWDGTGAAPAGLDRVEFLVATYSAAATVGAETLAGMARLQVIQLLSAGVEGWLDRVPAGVVLCNGRGVHGASTAELAVAGISSLLRELPRFHADQADHVWSPGETDGLDGKRVLIVGAGDIGQRVAAAVTAFGAAVTFVARHRRDDVPTIVHPIAELAELLPRHDIVVIAVPHTPQTHRLVDAAFLAAMPDGAMLVNIARGQVVDTDALVAELVTRRLQAFLDVTDPEPLPGDHPLWAVPNVLITPHIGGGTHGWEQRAYRLVREQIVRFDKGEPLENVVIDGY
jgi:phosphoglycerate dehydrogenase-like enzyme